MQYLYTQVFTSILLGFAAVMLGEAYFVLMQKTALHWWLKWGVNNVKNPLVKEVLFQCDVCFSGQCALWLSIGFHCLNGFHWSSIFVTLLSISIAVIGAKLLGSKLLL